MRKLLTFMIIFAGTVSCVLMFGIMLYIFAPGFRQAITAMVKDRDIPVVTVQDEPVINDDSIPAESGTEPEIKPDSYYKITYIDNEPVALEDEPKEHERVIVDRQYHEDCGTGKGYWVITYDDGTVEIE